MADKVFRSFLEHQYQTGMELARESDLFELLPEDGVHSQAYLVRFRCRGLVRGDNGEVAEADRFEVAITFPDDYLRRVDPAQIVTWCGPRDVFHPNISDKAPVVCVGRLRPGTDLVDLVLQLYEIITYNRVTMREDDALNRDACVWARQNQHRFPVDSRPIKRRRRKSKVAKVRVRTAEKVEEA